MALSGLKIFDSEPSNLETAEPNYKLGLYSCELEVKDEKQIDYSKSGKPLATFQKRTYQVKIKSLPFLHPTNWVSGTNNESKLNEAIYYNKTALDYDFNNYSKVGLYTFLKERRFFHSVQGIFPSAFGDFEGTYKTINSTEEQNYGIIEGTIHLCID